MPSVEKPDQSVAGKGNDLAIAATGFSRDLTVLMRDVRQFVQLDVRAINPFESLPR